MNGSKIMFKKVMWCALGLVLAAHAPITAMQPQPGTNLWQMVQDIEITAEEIESTLEELQEPMEDLVGPLEDLVEEVGSLIETFERSESVLCDIATEIENIEEELLNIDDDLDCLLKIADSVEELEKAASAVDATAQQVESVFEVLVSETDLIEQQVVGLESQFDEIQETVEAIDSKIDTLQDTAEQIEDTVSVVASMLDDIDTRLIDIDDTLLEIESTLDELQPVVESVLEEVVQLNETTSIIDSKVDVLLEDVEVIEGQISVIESLVDIIDENTQNIVSGLDALLSAAESIDDTVEDIESVLDIIEDVVLDTQETVHEIESTLEAIEDQVLDIQEEVEDIQSTVENIASDTDTIISISETIETHISIIESLVEIIDSTVSVIDGNIDASESLLESILDGVTMLVEQGCTYLISQADIDNAGPNNPYEITEPGTYCVIEPLVSGCKKMICINSSCVTLDLHGYCLEGDPGKDVICVEDSGNVVIKNGSIDGGNIGIHVTDSTEVLISEVRFFETEDNAIQVEDSASVMISECHMDDTGDSGIVVTGVSSKCVIRDTIVCSPQSYAAGILLDEEVTYCCVFNTKVTQSRGNGFQDLSVFPLNVRGGGGGGTAGGNIFLSCVAQECRRAGFVIGSSSVVRECNAIGNQMGFEIMGDASIIKNCISEINTDSGIVVGGGADNNGILSNYVVGVAPDTCTGISDMGANTRVFNNLVQNCTTNYAGNVPLTEESPTTQTGYWANIDLL